MSGADRDPKVVVIGAGVIGSAIAFTLAGAADKPSVLLLDSQPGCFGATAYSAGIIRRHHTLAADARLAGESLPIYRDWAKTIGGDCGYRPVGFLMLADRSQEKAVRANTEAAAPWGVPPQWLEADELRERFPALAIRDDDLGVLEPDGGFGDPTAATLSWQDAFRSRGGTHRVGVLVERLTARTGGGWSIGTNIGAIEADQVVVANGLGAAALLATVGAEVPITPRRIGLAQIRFATPAATRAKLPSCIDDVTGTYFAPRDNGLLAVGVRARPECDPRLQVVPLSADEIEEARSRGAGRLRELPEAVTVGSQVAGDGYTPDRRPVLGPVSDGLPGLHVAAGFSGGGFKIAPAVGEHLSAAVLTGSTPEAIRPYRADRFTSGDLLTAEEPYVYM